MEPRICRLSEILGGKEPSTLIKDSLDLEGLTYMKERAEKVGSSQQVSMSCCVEQHTVVKGLCCDAAKLL